MKFNFVSLCMNPLVLTFFAIATGLIFGKVKFRKFSFGISGTLFTGLVIGYFAVQFAGGVGVGENGYKAAQYLLKTSVVDKRFLILWLVVFVATIGLLAAKDLGFVVRKYGLKFIVMGALVTFVAAVVTYAATAVVKDTNAYEVAGVYTGALTSSPGLGAAIETAESHAEEYAGKFETLTDGEKKTVLSVLDPSGQLTIENTPSLTEEQRKKFIQNASAGVGIGHAIGYPFGVIIVIFAVNFFPGIFGMDVAEEKRKYAEEISRARSEVGGKEIETTPFNLLSFILVCVIGYLLGAAKIYMGPLGYVGLGATGGVLIGGLILGYIGKIGPISFRMDPKTLGVLRDIGLAFFLAIVGLRFGFGVVDAILGSGVVLAIVSLVIGIVALMLGFILGRYVFKLNWILLAGALCGGMTSTPGLGAAVEALESDDPAAGYGATYPFALLGMIVFTIVLHKLPLL